jgi:hypothetical protein
MLVSLKELLLKFQDILFGLAGAQPLYGNTLA